jgi:hypothetical protein
LVCQYHHLKNPDRSLEKEADDAEILKQLDPRLGEDDFFQEVVIFDEVKISHGVEAGRNKA